MDTTKIEQYDIVKQKPKTTKEIKKYFATDYFKSLGAEKTKYAIAFCLANNLNPAKNQVSLIPNKKGVLNPVIDYQQQLDQFEALGYSKVITYLPDEINPVAIKTTIYKGAKELGSYVAYVKEWQGQIGKPLMITRIRSITQAIKELVPEMRRQLNNFEINEVIKSQNEIIETQETMETLKQISATEKTTQPNVNEEEVKDFLLNKLDME